MLVEEVGHERDNALAEVRRSFGGDYDPLYQCAYLIGGLQVRALHRELVGSGRNDAPGVPRRVAAGELHADRSAARAARRDAD